MLGFVDMHHAASGPRTPSPNEYYPHIDKDNNPYNNNGASLLRELYEPDYDHPTDPSPSSAPAYHQPVLRRATYPSVRHDQDIQLYPQPTQPFYPVYYPAIKHEDIQPPLVVPSHNPYHQQHQHHQSYLPPLTAPSSAYPHSAMPVQHTDDAASKETQYLRRRCFNCHTTEPPSWRRSTLNPGKIVCNKCGLYERTHLRPRPLRFDELRAGNKARKSSNASQTQKSPSAVKKEPTEGGILPRRSSVSSSASSASGASDWDDNVSVYSASSGPPTSFNSPAASSFPLSRDSQSPPLDPSASIRLPNAPFSDIQAYNNNNNNNGYHTLQQQQQHQQYHPHPHSLPSPPLSSPAFSNPLDSPSHSHSTSSPTPRKSNSNPYYSPSHQVQQLHHAHTLSPQALSSSLSLSSSSSSPSPLLSSGSPLSSPSPLLDSASGLRRMSVSNSLPSLSEEPLATSVNVNGGGAPGSLTEELESALDMGLGLGLGVVHEEAHATAPTS